MAVDLQENKIHKARLQNKLRRREQGEQQVRAIIKLKPGEKNAKLSDTFTRKQKIRLSKHKSDSLQSNDHKCTKSKLR